MNKLNDTQASLMRYEINKSENIVKDRTQRIRISCFLNQQTIHHYTDSLTQKMYRNPEQQLVVLFERTIGGQHRSTQFKED